VVDPEPLDDYPGGPHDTGLLWRYHVHVARKAADVDVFINVKLTILMLICVKMTLMFVKLPVYVRRVPEVPEVVAGAVVRV